MKNLDVLNIKQFVNFNSYIKRYLSRVIPLHFTKMTYTRGAGGKYISPSPNNIYTLLI
jgi:hypothetical protein